MLRLRGTFSPNPRMAPLIDGTVQPRGIEIAWEGGQAGELHERHLRDNAFDVFEFSISHYMISKQRPNGRWDWTALPVFLSKALMTLNTHVNVRSGVEGPRNLKGKRFGLPDYSMTAGLWFRGMLRALYGIRTRDMSWYVGRPREHSHAALLGMDEALSPDLPVTWLDRKDALNEMLQRGEIDAAYPAGREIPIDFNTPNVRPLFPDGGRAFVEAFVRKTGFAPVNHTVVVQRRIVEKDPWVAEALFEAFERSKQEAYRRERAAAVLFPRQEDFDEQAAVFGADPFPFGLAANRPMLAMAAEQSVEDGLARERIDVDELFWPSLRAT